MCMTSLTGWVEGLDQINNILHASSINNKKYEIIHSKRKKKEDLEQIKKDILNTWLQTEGSLQVVAGLVTPLSKQENHQQKSSHNLQTNSIGIRSSTLVPKSERTSTISGHHPGTTIQLPPKYQQLCRSKLPHSVHTRWSTNFWLWQGNNCKLNRIYPPRVEGINNGMMAGTNVTQATHNKQGHAARTTTVDNYQQTTNGEHDVWVTQHKTNNSKLPCNSRLPNKSNMAQGNQSLILCYMAHANSNHSHKVVPRVAQTQKGHMQQNRQGVQSTKEPINDQDTHMVHTPQQHLREISVNIKDMKQIM